MESKLHISTPPPTTTCVSVCCNDGYIPVLHVFLKSLFLNNPNEPLEIHVFNDGISTKNTKLIEYLSRRFNKLLYFHTVNDDIFATFPSGTPALKFSRAANLRLAIPNLLPNHNKTLYLDIDTLVEGNIRELYDTDLNGFLIGAVIDLGIGAASHPKRLGYPEEYYYINSGVLLMDLDGLRRFHFYEKCVEEYAKYPDLYLFPDQDIINMLLFDKIKKLPLKYNAQVYLFDKSLHIPAPWDNQVENALSNPAIIHFNNTNKPWMRPRHKLMPPYSDRFDRYRDLPPKTKGIMKFGDRNHLIETAKWRVKEFLIACKLMDPARHTLSSFMTYKHK